VAKKKKPGKQAPLLSLSPEEQILLNRFLEDFGTSAPEKLVDQIPSIALAEKLVETLPLDHPATPHFLAAIGKAFPQKAMQKAVRKKRFKLKQRGISSAEPEPANEPVLVSTTERPSAYLGPIDGAGNRPVLIAIPQRLSGVDLAMGVVNDEKGILDFVYGRYSRKKMKEIKDVFFSKVPYMVETTLSHVATVLEHAYNLEKENPGRGAGEYLRLRPWLLKNADLLDRPAVLDAIPLSSINPAMLTDTRIQRLLHHELMASWVLDPERLGTLMEEIGKAEESPIFISEAQRKEHVHTIKEQGIAEIFREKDREILRSRLQEMAHLFFKIGEEALARLCLAASISLDEKDSLLKVNPLLSALVERSLAFVDKPARDSPLIVR
jgi:hypothetical protein